MDDYNRIIKDNVFLLIQDLFTSIIICDNCPTSTPINLNTLVELRSNRNL